MNDFPVWVASIEEIIGEKSNGLLSFNYGDVDRIKDWFDLWFLLSNRHAEKQAWSFQSLPLLAYSCAMVICFHLFVIGYEEPTLQRTFPGTYPEYLRRVPRWIPRPPRGQSA
jgi:Nucleotidyl transferase AbiEii toxin, Type IV TA system